MTAIVEEAAAYKTYVCAHAYNSDAIARALKCGVRSIEHGNLLDAPTAQLMRVGRHLRSKLPAMELVQAVVW